MDKKTLIAFLLIAVIIILTPVYYNILYPTPENISGADSLSIDTVTNARTSAPVIENVANETKPIKALPSLLYAEQESVIETDLYLASVSNVNGGSFSSFQLKKYPGIGQENVQLIHEINSNNLLVSFRGVDGNDIALSGTWEALNEIESEYVSTKKQLKYRLSYKGNYIYKKLTFYPDNYTVDIEIDFGLSKTNLSQGMYELAWNGGLPVTEKNVKDDLDYFNSYLYQGGETHSPKVAKDTAAVPDRIKGETLWAAIRTKYFICAMIPEEAAVGGSTSAHFTDGGNKVFNVSIALNSTSTKTVLFLGPLEYSRIKEIDMGLDSIMNFGWSFIRPISKGIHYLLVKMNGFIPNYGIILIIFSVLVKILVYPLTKKSYESTQKMQSLQPELNKLKEKYKNDQQKFGQAQLALFREKGVNPLGGCFPILLQMPLLFALFQVFRSTIELRGAPFVLWITDLSAPDAIFNLPFNIPIYGGHVAVLPVLMGITMFIQQKMTPVQTTGGQQKFMSYFMTIFFTLLFNNFPSGLNLYYTLFNVLTILQQKYLTPASALLPNAPRK